MPGHIAWNVYLKDKLIDTVFYNNDCTEWYVKHGLINHDGYSPDITIKAVYSVRERGSKLVDKSVYSLSPLFKL